jgi:hypothetical protein
MKLVCAADHVYDWDERTGAPRCPTCGSTAVQRALVGPPHFVGTASGPHVETKALDPIAVDLTQKES